MPGDLSTAIDQFQRCIEDRDRDLADRLLDPDYALVLVTPTRVVFPRQQWLETLEHYVVHDYVVDEQVIDESDSEGAVLTRARMRATVLGEDRSGVFVISDFWRYRDGSWKVWRRHSTPFSAGALPQP